MVAVDTNILVRFFTQDEPRQVSRAAALLKGQEVWIAKSVLLEAEWVLRSLYGFPPERVAAALRALAGLSNVRLEDPLGVTKAIDWFSHGIDFADALHLASCGEADRFVTFDKKLSKRAGRIAAIPVATL